MIAKGCGSRKRAKQPADHQMRERRACLGELVQIDGSDHAWFEERGPKCTLLSVYRRCHRSTAGVVVCAYTKASLVIVKQLGTILSVTASRWPSTATNTASFGSIRSRPSGLGSGLTQFGRAMQELDIQILCANYPTSQRACRTGQPNLARSSGQRIALTGDFRYGRLAMPFCPSSGTISTAALPSHPAARHDAHRPCAARREPGPDPHPSRDPHSIQKPDRAVQQGHLPDPVRPPRLTPCAMLRSPCVRMPMGSHHPL